MKINKLLLLFAVPFAIQLTFSCCCCDDDEYDIAPYLIYVADSIKVQNADNSGEVFTSIPATNQAYDSIAAKAYGIELYTFYDDYYGSIYSPKTIESMFSSAYACSCGGGGGGIQFTNMLDFKIRTVYDFNSVKRAGDDVTEYFRFYDELTLEIEPINQIEIEGKDRKMLLYEQPTLSNLHQFIVSFQTQDSTLVSDTTLAVKLY